MNRLDPPRRRHVMLEWAVPAALGIAIGLTLIYIALTKGATP